MSGCLLGTGGAPWLRMVGQLRGQALAAMGSADAFRSALHDPMTESGDRLSVGPRCAPRRPDRRGELAVRSTSGRMDREETTQEGRLYRVERMERGETDETGRTAGPSGTGTTGPGRAEAGAGERRGRRVVPSGPMTYSAADEERRRGVRRMKPLATGLLLAGRARLRPRQLGAAGARAWAGYVAAAAEAGHGGRAGRLVRRHRAVPAAAGPAHPAHRDHPDQEGPAGQSPGRVRRRELPLRATSYGSGCARSGSAAGSAAGWPSRSTPTG